MSIDFSGLQKLTQESHKNAPETDKRDIGTQPQEQTAKAVRIDYFEQEAVSVRLTQLQDDYEKVRKAYKHYQQNVLKSEILRCEILKEVKAGSDNRDLLLKAVECISCMTNDSLFFQQIKKELR